MKCFVICAVIAVSFAVATAGPVVDEHQTPHINSIHSNEPTIEESLMKKLNNKCSKHDISSCMMLKLVTYFNRMLKKSQIELGDVEISQTSTETTTIESSRSLKDVEKMSDEEQLTTLIGDKLYNFVRTRSMKWHVTDGADLVVSGRSDNDGGLNLGFSIRPVEGATEESRKKKNEGGNMNGIMAAAMMKIGLLKALAFKALVILVGKALLVSKLALVLAAIIGLKKLLSQEKHVTYEVVAQPHHDHHEHHVSSGGHDSYGGGGWGRTFDAKEAQNLAYSAQVPSN
ncbi:unnamed protein product [Ceutorhynchus assimilis]|uniref:Uncharacterized protein n=1 Tax=Ceutorhynchus assimilis TaxID=467358 RepID=A0A9N9MEK4_9CUCU|nr:unnamed protein product [Ceutorhynchus assimilis]